MIAKPKIGTHDFDGFYQSKYQTAQYYMQKLLPKTASQFSAIMAGSSSVMKIQDSHFGSFDFIGFQSQ